MHETLRRAPASLLAHSALAGGAALWLACGAPSPPPAPAFEDAGPAAFEGAIETLPVAAFDVVTADFDLDGDPDLLLNGHHMAPLQLFENRDGVLHRINAPGADESGLYDNPGVPYLFAPREAMESAVTAAGEPGLYVWHDGWRMGSWRFLWLDPDDPYGGLRASLSFDADVDTVEGLRGDELVREGPAKLQVRLGPGRRSFGVKPGAITTALELHVDPGSRGDPPALFAGATRARVAGADLQLAKPDPHGIAWIDLEGSPEPEIYVTRGGLAGTLRPPRPPKQDLYYRHRPGDAGPIYELAPIPPDYRRGRRVEAVDVDGDGSLELFVSGRHSASGLLFRDPRTGLLQDRAHELGLDQHDLEIATFGDLDGDGLPDLFVLRGARVDVGRNPGHGRFRFVSGSELGLVLPSSEAGRQGRLFVSSSLRLFDFDANGALDLLVLGHGPKRTPHLFLRDGTGFRDATREVGLEGVEGADVVVLLDADDDGFEDAMAFGEETVLWHNRDGKRFEIVPLGPGLPHPHAGRRVTAATAADFDGDGRIDVVAVDEHAHLLHHVTESRNGFVQVDLRDGARPAIGAVVRAYRSDGRVVARRYGSVQSTPVSQGLLPLHFGLPGGKPLDHLSVQWPGSAQTVAYPAPAPGSRVVIERRGAVPAAPGASGYRPPQP